MMNQNLPTRALAHELCELTKQEETLTKRIVEIKRELQTELYSGQFISCPLGVVERTPKNTIVIYLPTEKNEHEHENKTENPPAKFVFASEPRQILGKPGLCG